MKRVQGVTFRLFVLNNQGQRAINSNIRNNCSLTRFFCESWAEQLHASLDKIQRRLDGVRYKELKAILTDAIKQQLSTGDTQKHKHWIQVMLVDYYDPMYDFQIAKKEDLVVFRGQQDEVISHLKEHYQII